MLFLLSAWSGLIPGLHWWHAAAERLERSNFLFPSSRLPPHPLQLACFQHSGCSRRWALPHGCAPQVYSSSVTPQVKRQCLTTLAKMLHFNSADTLAGERVGSHVGGCGLHV